MSHRLSIFILILLALVSWAGLVFFTRYVPPYTPLALSAFFLILGIAIASSFAPLAFVVEGRLLARFNHRPTIRQMLRQGLLLALVVIFNLILRLLHSWNIFMAIVLLCAAIVIEILALARKS